MLSRCLEISYLQVQRHTEYQGMLVQLSQLSEPLWTDPDPQSGFSACELISTLKKKRCRWEMIHGTFLQNPRMQGKATTTTIIKKTCLLKASLGVRHKVWFVLVEVKLPVLLCLQELLAFHIAVYCILSHWHLMAG